MSRESTSSRSPSPDAPPRRLAGLRVAVLLYSYYPADPRPRRAAEAMVDEGAEVDLFCLRDGDSQPLRDEVNGVRVFRVPIRKRRGSKFTYILQYGSFILACFFRLTFGSLRRRYRLVHVHNMPDILVFAALLPRLFGARVLLDLHDPMPELMQGIYGFSADHRLVRWLKRFEKLSIAFAHHVLTPNKAFRDLFISRSCPAEKITIVMNSPQSEIFDPGKMALPEHRDEISTATTPYRVMHHGFIAERHGIDTALEAIAMLRKDIPGIELHIYGAHTEYVDKMEAMAKRFDLGDSYHYHGYRPQPEIARAISTADLGLIPNHRNPFTEINMPTRIFEYLAMGKPVIVPDTKGIRDYFDDESAIFFRPDDPADLAATILRAYQRRDRLAPLIERGQQVYRQHRWESEREILIDVTVALT